MDVGRQRVRPPTSFPEAGRATLARGAWQLEPGRSTVAFAVPYWWGLGTVKGHFRQYAGRLELGDRPAIELTIDAASVDTGNARRDRHLRSEEFFAVEVDATVTAVDDEFQLEAETFVMHRGLGITWNPAQITRPWSKLVVSGRLVQVPVEPAEPRAFSPGRRFARACRN
jgi:hypothetical protein